MGKCSFGCYPYPFDVIGILAVTQDVAQSIILACGIYTAAEMRE